MESIEQTKVRLDNIGSIEPILTALRSIALSTLQAALRRLESATLYYTQLLEVQRLALVYGLPRPTPSRHRILAERGARGRCALLIVGNQRGLCGPFTSTVMAAAQQTLARLRAADAERGPMEVDLMVLGEHVRRAVRQRALQTTWEGALPATSVPSFGMAAELAETGLQRYEASELDAFCATYNHYLGAGRYEPRTVTLIPCSPLEHPDEEEVAWPPPIVDTDAQSLHNRVTAQLTALSLYRVLLISAAAEHSARFQLMEGASQNSRELIEELTLTYHTGRQEAVTEEVLELAVSAGLLRGEQS